MTFITELDPLANNVIFYRHPLLETGHSVTFNTWDEDGTIISSDVPHDFEVPNSGIYYLNFTAPATSGYVLTTGTHDDSSYVAHIFDVGTPSDERVYYFEGEINSIKSNGYIIYDDSDTVIQSGTLTDLGNGFHYASVGSLIKPWIMEVSGFISLRSTGSF